MKWLYAIMMFCVLSANGYAMSSQDESRYQALTQQIRCMTCANQNVADSQSVFAQNTKLWVREQIEEGRSDTEIRHELITRFGESVIYTPILKSSTFVLWAMPVLLVCMVGIFWFRGRRR